MTYVHLANGEVKHFDAKELASTFGDEPPRVFRDNGTEHHVIGVYPDEVEYDNEPDIAAENEQKDRAEFDAWKAERDAAERDGEKE